MRFRSEKYRYIRNFLQAPMLRFGQMVVSLRRHPKKEHTSCLPGELKVHDPDGVFFSDS